MYDYKLLEAFTAVVESNGFEKAANSLYITQSAVSQRVRQLEETVGQILLVRSNPPKPTNAGNEILAHFNKVRLLESELRRDITPETGGGFTTVSIGLNVDTLATWFFDAVQDTVIKNRILLDLHVDDQEATHQMLKDGVVAGCISTRSKPFQSCTCTYLGTMTYRMFCAGSTYKKFFPDGYSIEAMKNVPVIIYNEKDTLHSQMFKTAFKTQPADYPKMYIPSEEQYLDAVLRGFGVGMMPDNQCARYHVDGTLVDAFAPHTVLTPLYWHRWSLTSATLDALTKSLLSAQLII